MMLTMGPMASLKDCNFPTQEASCLTGKYFEVKKNTESVRIRSYFSLGISKQIVKELIIIPRYLTV